jgi:hypothetical protein
MKSKAVTIDGHLVKINSEGIIFRLNGGGSWVQISNKDLYILIKG